MSLKFIGGSRLLHEDATPRALEFLRVLIFGIWLVSVVFDPLPIISHLPTSVFHPAGVLLRCLPSSVQLCLVTAPFLYGLKMVTSISLLLVILNKAMKPAAVLSCILLTVYQGIVRGFGHINHADIAVLYGAYFITLFAIADSIVKKRRGERAKSAVNPNSIPFIALLSCMLFTYSFIGIFRALHGGVELFTSDTMTYWIVHNSHRSSFYFLWDLDDWILSSGGLQAFFKAGLPVVTFFEIFAPLCLVVRWFRYTFIMVMIPFLFLNWFFMNVLFWQNILLCVLLFDLSYWFGKYEKGEGLV
jgi:hypothetical protein